ncbi:hypothetical protein Vadar_025254 [Vaccinium darrowii]|uniref:Uncharacterized protein n=1 Tax=Vaccinium darrowii TaxID=229202 RepID=A0ACB7YH22_9ERIC|nr:hypothetical protein Vadar_025254 [Vaccinium darrowii]
MGADWGPVVVAVVLFILLSPGLLFQFPARMRVVEFGNIDRSSSSTHVDMDPDSQKENADESKVEDGVNQYGHSTGFEVSKLYIPAVPRYLNQQSWR